MSAGGPADNVYKSSEASPLGELLAHINQAPGEERNALTPPQNFLTRGREWPQGYCTSMRQCRTPIQHCCAEMPPHKCQLTVNRKDDGNGLFNVREGFIWSHFTVWVITAIISKSASFRVIMAVTVMQYVRHRWGLKIIIAVLQLVKKIKTNKKQIAHKTDVSFALC